MNDALNPMGTDGFEFIEYTAQDTRALEALFKQLGFSPIARHRSKDTVLYRQGNINFVINHEPDSFAQSFADVHGPSCCAFGIRVKDAAQAYKRALELGAEPFEGKLGPMELNIPAIRVLVAACSISSTATKGALSTMWILSLKRARSPIQRAWACWISTT